MKKITFTLIVVLIFEMYGIANPRLLLASPPPTAVDIRQAPTALPAAPPLPSASLSKQDYATIQAQIDAYEGVSHLSSGVLISQTLAPDAFHDGYFGRSIAVSGNTVVVGASSLPRHVGSGALYGAVYVFYRSTGNQLSFIKKVMPNDLDYHSEFAGAVAIDGDTLIVSAHLATVGNNVQQGAVYIFQRDVGGTNNWGQVKKIVSSDGTGNQPGNGNGDLFGASVGIRGDTLVVGSPYSELAGGDDQGATYIFSRNTGGTNNWGEVKKLTASDPVTGAHFGQTVAMDSEVIYVSAPYANSNHGAVYLFLRNQGGADNWGQSKILTATPGATNLPSNAFGYAITLSNLNSEVAILDSGQSAVYIFSRHLGGVDNWGLLKIIPIPNPDLVNQRASAGTIGFAGDVLAVGNQQENIGLNTEQGVVYIFQRNTGGSGQWGQQDTLILNNGFSNDYFGGRVIVDANLVFVGAPFKFITETYRPGALYTFQISLPQTGISTQLTQTIASDGAAGDHYGYAVALSADMIAIGAPKSTIGANADQGAVYLFKRTTGIANDWRLLKKLVASGGASGDEFGFSLAIDVDTLVIGSAPANNGDAQGKAYIFRRNFGGADNWGQFKTLMAGDGTLNDQFGHAVAIQGETIVVGARNADLPSDENQGAVYILGRNTGGADNWGQVKKLVASDASTNASFGSAVAIDSDLIVVGTPNAASQTGAAYVFARDAGGANNWGQSKKIVATDGAVQDHFGKSVAISQNRVVIGAPEDDVGAIANQGSAYVFERHLGGTDNWGLLKKLLPADGATLDSFGVAVDIYDDVIAIGSHFNDNGLYDTQQGAIYLFQRNAGGPDQWGQSDKMAPAGRESGDIFGFALALQFNILVGGAPYKDMNGISDRGAAYLFEVEATGKNQWSAGNKLITNDGQTVGEIGYAVDIDGDWMIVGAPQNGVTPGWAYIFKYAGGQWGLVKKIAASNGHNLNGFGKAVAISGDVAVVGAPGTNVGANSGQGAAYVFARHAGGSDNWGEIKQLAVASPAVLDFDDRFGRSVAISGNTIVVGAVGDDVDHFDEFDGSFLYRNASQGSAHIFERNQGGADQWGHAKYITADDGAAQDAFGFSVAIHADTLVVGAYLDDDSDASINQNKGAAYVFYRGAGVGGWGQVAKMTDNLGLAEDQLGYSVGISGDIIVVGIPYDDIGATVSQGSVKVYARNKDGADHWGLVKTLTMTDGAANDTFGWSVDVSGDTLIVGAFTDTIGSSQQGSAVIFRRNLGGTDNWGQDQKFIAADGMHADYYGWAVAISKNLIAVGAKQVDVGGIENQGAVYTYRYKTISVYTYVPNTRRNKVSGW